MSELTDEVRALATKANECRTEGAIGFLVLAVEALCDELDAHQHTYYGPDGMRGQWLTTQAQREIVNPSQKVFEQQAAQKLADKAKAYEPRNEISDRWYPR